MSTALLLLFTLTLLVLLAYTIKQPSLAVPIGMMTYSYKQIAALAVPLFQRYDTLLNFLIAAPILFVFLARIFTNIRLSCHSNEGKSVMILVWTFLLYFWVSSMWSPFYGTDSWRFFPYFIIYFWILPLLIDEDPSVMTRAFLLAWGLTFLGALGLLFSPDFYVSPDIERMVVHYQVGRFEESNPLVLADMGAYLIMMSLLVLFSYLLPLKKGTLWNAAQMLMVVASLILGIWLAVSTSRGETITGIACSCLFVALVRGKSVFRSLAWLGSLLVISLLTISLVVVLFLPKASLGPWSARYSQAAMAEGSEQRQGLIAKNLQFAMASPAKFLFGIGARGSEKNIGAWPHNHFVQAFSETGIIGLSLFGLCCFLALRFGFRTLALARASLDEASIIYVAFILSLYIYHLIVLSKKGSLTFVDTYMWLGLATFSFDRIDYFLQFRHNFYRQK